MVEVYFIIILSVNQRPEFCHCWDKVHEFDLFCRHGTGYCQRANAASRCPSQGKKCACQMVTALAWDVVPFPYIQLGMSLVALLLKVRASTKLRLAFQDTAVVSWSTCIFIFEKLPKWSFPVLLLLYRLGGRIFYGTSLAIFWMAISTQSGWLALIRREMNLRSNKFEGEGCAVIIRGTNTSIVR